MALEPSLLNVVLPERIDEVPSLQKVVLPERMPETPLSQNVELPLRVQFWACADMAETASTIAEIINRIFDPPKS
jgi:hypothetical protein